VGSRADAGLDHTAPADDPRLRTTARSSRDLRLLGHDHDHDPPARPQASFGPAAIHLSFRAGSKLVI
jgi:hypothetical protein